MGSPVLTWEDLDTAVLTIDADGRQVLFVMISRDGSVNRQGDGSLRADGTLYISTTQEPLFDHFVDRCPPLLALPRTGRYEVRERPGVSCKLQLALFNGAGQPVAPGGKPFSNMRLRARWEWLYGGDGVGPAAEIAQVVGAATAATDAWWREMQRLAPRGQPDRGAPTSL